MVDSARPVIAEGAFSKTPLSHILMYCYERRLSGVLTVIPFDASENITIHFEEGSPVALGVRGSNAHVLARYCGDYQSTYRFMESTTEIQVPRTRLDPLTIVAQYIRSASLSADIQIWVQQAIARWQDIPLRVRPSERFARMQFTDDEKKIVDVLRAQPMSIAQLQKVTGLLAQQVHHTIYLLTVCRLIEPSGPRAPSPKQSGSKVIRAERSGSEDLPLLDENAVEVNPNITPYESNETQARPASDLPPNLSEFHRSRWIEIESFYGSLRKQSYFELLGVPKDVSEDHIQRAFVEKAKVWHPDRLPSELSALKEKVSEIFHEMTQAQRTLMDAQKRSRYLEQLNQGNIANDEYHADSKKVMDALGADQAYRKAEFYMKTKDIVSARSQIEEAIKLDPEPAIYHGLYAWILFHQAPLTDALLNEALDAADVALSKQPRYEWAHYYRGCILKSMNRAEEALKAFEEALAINPQFLEAQREVRLAQSRRQQPRARSVPGGALREADRSNTGQVRKKTSLHGMLKKILGQSKD